MANSGFDQLFLFFSAIGYQYGVVPVDIALVLVLALRRRYRESVFVAVATGGSGLLNVVAKQAFARDRPSLWESIAPEHNFSFPSGHAMGRSEEHTSELQSLMRISYAVFCLK